MVKFPGLLHPVPFVQHLSALPNSREEGECLVFKLKYPGVDFIWGGLVFEAILLWVVAALPICPMLPTSHLDPPGPQSLPTCPVMVSSGGGGAESS